VDKILKFDDKCMVVRLHEWSPDAQGSLYEAARRCWKTTLSKAEQADYVLVLLGNDPQIKGVFKPKHWFEIPDEICNVERERCKKEYKVNTDSCQKKKRIGFEGDQILDDTKYLNKEIQVKCVIDESPVFYYYY
jgi:hypothetical protein